MTYQRVGKKDDDEFQYQLNKQALEYTDEEKDFGVIAKFETHISIKVVNTANTIMGVSKL